MLALFWNRNFPKTQKTANLQKFLFSSFHHLAEKKMAKFESFFKTMVGTLCATCTITYNPCSWCSDHLKMGRNFVFRCILVFFFLFSTQNREPKIVITRGLVINQIEALSLKNNSPKIFSPSREKPIEILVSGLTSNYYRVCV